MIHGHVESFTKLVLSNTPTLRSLCGPLLLTSLCPRGSDYIKAGNGAGEKHREQVRAEGKQHQRGPLRIHQLVALFVFLKTRHGIEEAYTVSSSGSSCRALVVWEFTRRRW